MRKREKIAFIFVTATVLSTGLPALQSKRDTHFESFEFPSSWLDERDAVVALVPTTRLARDANSKVWRARGPMIGKIDPDNRFANQVSIADCTGFLIGQDILITAARCIPEEKDAAAGFLKKNLVLRTFQYYSTTEADAPQYRPSVLDSEVITMKEVLFRGQEHGEDNFAVIRLEKKFELVRPVKLKRGYDVRFGNKVTTISHPHGLAKKGDFDAILSQEPDPKTQLFPISTAHGHSYGEPIFDPNSHGVIGLVVSDSIAIQSDAVIERLRDLDISHESI